jgi:hypothetical protein
MRVNPYYNKDCDTLIIQHFNNYLGFVEISMTGFKDWMVLYYDASIKAFTMNPQKGVRTYSASTNWGVIKLLRKLLKDAK